MTPIKPTPKQLKVKYEVSYEIDREIFNIF